MHSIPLMPVAVFSFADAGFPTCAAPIRISETVSGAASGPVNEVGICPALHDQNASGRILDRDMPGHAKLEGRLGSALRPRGNGASFDGT